MSCQPRELGWQPWSPGAEKAPRRAGGELHGDAMHRLYVLPLVLLFALRGPRRPSARRAPASPFTSEAIDTGIFKEGEVERLEGHFLLLARRLRRGSPHQAALLRPLFASRRGRRRAPRHRIHRIDERRRPPGRDDARLPSGFRSERDSSPDRAAGLERAPPPAKQPLEGEGGGFKARISLVRCAGAA